MSQVEDSVMKDGDLPIQSPTQMFWRDIRKHPAAIIGVTLLTLIILSVVFAHSLSPYDPVEPDYSVRLQPPSSEHIFGTDAMGRDILTRIMYGGRISLWVGLISVGISASAGIVIGLTAGYFGGWADEVLMRIMDMIMSMPSILLSLTIIFALGGGLVNIMIAIGVSSIPSYARTVRGQVLAARDTPYVEAAKAAGAGNIKIMFRHILPNVMAPVIVMATLGLAGAILSVAALGFLGLGIAPPTPEWGVIISDGRARLYDAWWIATFPGLAIMATVLATNLLGDGLRDSLDPRLRGR
ncbi:MAG: ABC transporter permease [Clostridia bacterium]